MKALKISGRIVISLGFLFWALFQLTKEKFSWPVFITDNIFYIWLGCTIIGYVFLFLYYSRTKNRKKAMELVIIASVIAVLFGLVYLIT